MFRISLGSDLTLSRSTFTTLIFMQLHNSLDSSLVRGGGRVERKCWVNFQCQGVLLVWMIVGQGPIALAVGAGGGLFGLFFSHLSFLFSFSLSLGDGPIKTEILSQRAVKPKPTNQPTSRTKIFVTLFESLQHT